MEYSQGSIATLPYFIKCDKACLGRLKKKGNIKDLRFHYLHHEAISRFFEKGLSIPEVALISEHKDVRMFFRYTHLKAEDIQRSYEYDKITKKIY